MRVFLRLHVLDRVAIGLLAVGLLCVATGLLPTGSAGDAMTRIAPLLAFLGTVIVLAELTSEAEVFDVVAARVARAGRGSYAALFLLCVAFASVTTIALNLDTTAVLLTPVMLALASRVGIAPVPLAMTTVWLANTASLLLPVSNLTNLLAADRVALSPLGLAGRMWAPQLAAIAVTMVCLWLFYWRRGRRAGGPPTARPRTAGQDAGRARAGKDRPRPESPKAKSPRPESPKAKSPRPESPKAKSPRPESPEPGVAARTGVRASGPGAARAEDVRAGDADDTDEVRADSAGDRRAGDAGDAGNADAAGDARSGSSDRYRPPEVHRPADPVLFRACGLACAGFLLAILVADVELWVASATAAAVAVAAFAVRRRSALRLSLIPWRLLVMVPGMFLVVETVNANGLHDLLASAVGHDGGLWGLFRAAAVGGGLSNVLNNLPVYLAGEAAVPMGNHDQLLALLIGTNVGPVVTPWASLATLLWYERCHAYGVRVPLARLMGTGAVLAVAAVVASVLALTLTG